MKPYIDVEKNEERIFTRDLLDALRIQDGKVTTGDESRLVKVMRRLGVDVLHAAADRQSESQRIRLHQSSSR